MAESNATQVILTDDGLKIIKAQNTADNVASGVANLNDPNLMSVIEKQTAASQYAGLTSQYNVVLARAKEANISTTALTTAYTNLNTFMTAILTDTTKASDVNRDTYKELTDAYNTALSNVQTALSDSFNTDIDNMQSSVAVASQAASSAAIVASQATSTGSIASQAASQAASVANQASVDYKTLSSGVADGSVVHITTKTVIDNAVIGTAEIADAAITDAKIGNIKADKITAGTIDFSKIEGTNIDASKITTGKLDTDRLNVGKLSAVSSDLGDVTAGSLKGVNIVANSFSTPNGSFTTDSNGAVVASNLTIRGVTNLVYNAALLGGVGGSNPSIPGWNIENEGYYSNTTLHDGVSSIGFHNNTGPGVWKNFASSKLYPLNGLTGQPYSASVWFIEYGSDTSLQYAFTLAFFDANGNRVDGYVAKTWAGISSAQPWRYITINNAVSPSNAVYVGLQYSAYNGTGHALFSSPMLTQTSQATGYQPDTGNVVSAGEIDGSVINGSTINGTTFHGGDIISNANNTTKYYPMTITPDGAYKSTYFDRAVGLQSSVESGAIIYKYRSMIGNGKYLAYDSVINGQGLNLQSGYTSAKDTTFSNPVSTTTGYVIVNANDGITLHGDDQQITFNGTSADVTPKGVIITPYGNINPNGTQNIWYVGNNMNMKTASFGMDGSGTYGIQFNRSLDIGNFNINTYHTITSSDNGPIHFNRNDGKSVDIYAATVNYTSLVKSSLLSLKKNVKKADTAYWAQLVNSIDLATYQYKTDDNTSHLRLSSIVDDVNVTKQWQLPDVFISRDENGKLSGVDDSVLLNATLATVQEQQKQIDQLNGHNMELEARLNKLEAKLNG